MQVPAKLGKKPYQGSDAPQPRAAPRAVGQQRAVGARVDAPTPRQAGHVLRPGPPGPSSPSWFASCCPDITTGSRAGGRPEPAPRPLVNQAYTRALSCLSIGGSDQAWATMSATHQSR